MPQGATRPNAAQNGRRSPRTTGMEGLLRITSRASEASTVSIRPRVAKLTWSTSITPSGAPMAIAP
ncbi:hypothetical protein D3C84_1165320 [compost metagenome]